MKRSLVAPVIGIVAIALTGAATAQQSAPMPVVAAPAPSSMLPAMQRKKMPEFTSGLAS